MIYQNILDAMGHTPMVQLNHMAPEGAARILVKYEGLNVGGSIKTRVAYNMVMEAVRQGKITRDTIIVEPTSGNQGIGLSLIGAVLGYKVRIIMPDSVSEERRKLIRHYGAEVKLIHAGHRESGRNTVDFDFQVLKDVAPTAEQLSDTAYLTNDDNWVTVASYRSNNANETVITFDEPVVGRWFRLDVLKGDNSPNWPSTRIYEWSMMGIRTDAPGELPHEHSFGEWTVTKEATCTEEGSRERVCECGEKETEVIAALGHTAAEAVKENEKAATCTEAGSYESVVYCSVCHEDGLKKADLAAAIAAGSVQADTELVEQKILTGALCTAEVYELYKCHCGETHMRGYLKTEVNVNHEWIVDTTKTKTPATHFAEGHEDKVCKYCGAEAPAELEVIAKLPHSFVGGKCSVCGEENYIGTRNKRKHTEKMEIKKYCPRCNKKTTHKEKK